METNTVIKTIEEKKDFLKNDLVNLLSTSNSTDKGQWGLLNAQQTVEHISDSFRNYHGMDSKKILTPAERLPAMKDFLMSEKQFKPNTKNIEMPEIPSPPKHQDMKSAIAVLKTDINNFFDYFEKDKTKTITNVFFGVLNFEESVQLLHKHSMHHLRQFGLID